MLNKRAADSALAANSPAAAGMHQDAAGQDVRQVLDAASAQLDVGELLTTESFSLGAVLNAVEIGNPRLDAGALSARTSRG